jgi:hypothetical protein
MAPGRRNYAVHSQKKPSIKARLRNLQQRRPIAVSSQPPAAASSSRSEFEFPADSSAHPPLHDVPVRVSVSSLRIKLRGKVKLAPIRAASTTDRELNIASPPPLPLLSPSHVVPVTPRASAAPALPPSSSSWTSQEWASYATVLLQAAILSSMKVQAADKRAEQLSSYLGMSLFVCLVATHFLHFV